MVPSLNFHRHFLQQSLLVKVSAHEVHAGEEYLVLKVKAGRTLGVGENSCGPLNRLPEVTKLA